MKKKGYKEGMYQIVSRIIYYLPLVYCLVHEEDLGYKEGMYQIVSRNIYCVPLVYCLVHEEERVQGRYVPDSAHA